MISGKVFIASIALAFLIGAYAFSSFNPVLAYSGKNICIMSHLKNASSDMAARNLAVACRDMNR